MRDMPHARVVVLLNAALAIGATMVPYSADGSRCTIYVSQKQPRYVPYTETYKVRKWGLFHQTQSRVNFRVEYTNTWVNETVCCAGYEDRLGNCEPICGSSCWQGRCIKPDTCKCNSGFRLSTTSKYVCVPVCDHACENGYCELNNQCGCVSGYMPSPDGTRCLPTCEQDCEMSNARCVSPNTCECSPGYHRDNATGMTDFCAPICEPPCVNGKCTAPNTCTCHDGYEARADVFNCEPKCERPCTFGRCTMPNTCTCYQGYALNRHGDCEPICSQPCVKGTCIAPESCRCDDGYGLLDSSVYNCTPICSQGGCLNGVCSSPGVCSCNEGYMPAWNEEGHQLCLPFCKLSCSPFGKCVAPDTCSCFEGYRLVDSNSTDGQMSNNSLRATTACQPVCEKPCGPNSVCSQPNFCACKTGYERAENDVENVCKPICDIGCGANATCTAPNTCSCNEGYERDAEHRCVPSCSTTCSNGTCVAPDVCRCMNGYILTNESICVRFCGDDCESADCAARNECRDREAFETETSNGTTARSCTRVCKGHGVCVQEEEPCECSYGWSGWDCDQPTVCVSFVDPGDPSLKGLDVYNETNSSLTDARHYAPHCYRCNETVGNRSFCFAANTDDGSPTIGCFVETGSPCYSIDSRSTATVSTMAGTLAVITILIMVAASTGAYFALRRYRRKRIQQAIAQSALFQGCVANETLLSEEDT